MAVVKHLYEILVPCNYNTGKPVRTKHHKEWDKYVRKISGGLTLHQPSRGQWVDELTGKLYEDRVIPVKVVCSEKQIHKIMDFSLVHYKQEAVLAYRLSEFVIFKRKKQL